MALVNSSRVDIGLPQYPDTAPPELQPHLSPIYTAFQNMRSQIAKFAGVDEYPTDWWTQLTLDDTIYAGGVNRIYVPQTDAAMAFGVCVNLWDNAGVLSARKANATNNTKPACGFVTSSDHAVGIGSYCEVMVGNAFITGVGGMTRGSRYFLSTVDGLITNAAPVAAGNIEQVVGFALAPTRLYSIIDWAWIQH